MLTVVSLQIFGVCRQRDANARRVCTVAGVQVAVGLGNRVWIDVAVRTSLHRAVCRRFEPSHAMKLYLVLDLDVDRNRLSMFNAKLSFSPFDFSLP